jgi:hypothetical protein
MANNKKIYTLSPSLPPPAADHRATRQTIGHLMVAGRTTVRYPASLRATRAHLFFQSRGFETGLG